MPAQPLLLGSLALFLCLGFGGGTRGGLISDAILQFLTLPVLLAVGWRLLDADLPQPMSHALIFCGALLAVPLLQLVPLPPLVWTALPGRATVAEAARVAFGTVGWAPLSLTPTSTAQAALSLIPVFAIFGATLLLSFRERRVLAILAIAACLIEALLGLAQVAGGPASGLRPYEITSLDAAVGLFANPNHLALMLAVAIAFVVAWAVTAAQAITTRDTRREIDTGPIAVVIAGVAAVFVLLIAILASRSRAGTILSLVSLTASLTIVSWRPSGWSFRRLLTISAASFVIGAVGVLILAPDLIAALLARLADGGNLGSRFKYAQRTALIALKVLPFGAGVGSFVPVYGLYETATDIPAGIYINRAHCDWIEAIMESGVVGATLLALFCIWFVRMVRDVWRRTNGSIATIDVALMRVATIVIALVGLHSLIEYPLRTSGIAALFAFACGCLFAPVILRDRTGEARTFDRKTSLRGAPAKSATSDFARRRSNPSTLG